jgi:hypothetical protein
MTIRYTNTFQDILRFQFYSLKLFPNNLLFILAPLFITFLEFGRLSGEGLGGIALALTLAVLFVVAFALIMIITLLFIWLFSLFQLRGKKARSVICAHELIFQEEELVEKTAFNTNYHKWTGILNYQLTKTHIRIFIQKLQAHIIPRRELTPEEEKAVLGFREKKGISKI